MGQLEFVKGEELTHELVRSTFRIASSKKISRVLEQPNKYVLIYDDTGFRGENRFFDVIPNRLYIESYKKIVYTDFIEFKLEHFTHLLKAVNETFPHIYDFIINEKVESVMIKPAAIISNTNADKGRIEVAMVDVQKTQDFLLEPDNAVSLDIFVLAELIRRFYMGEKDFVNGFLILKQSMKFIKALLEEKVNADYVIKKIKDNPELVDNNNFFNGSSEKFYFQVFKNQIMRCIEKSMYLDSLDLKYLSALGTMGSLLNDKRFGRR